MYTNSAQIVNGTLALVETSPNPQPIWSMDFHFNLNEGQIIDGGYMYQRWFLLAYSIPNTSNYYKLVATAYGVSQESSPCEGNRWPVYLTLPAIDLRSQGGQ